MPATREQLIARWDTSEGKQLARTVSIALENPSTTLEELLNLVQGFPLVEEVAPHLDLRGLHLPPEDGDEYIHIMALTLPGARFDFLPDLGNIIDCNLEGAVFDGMQCIRSFFKSDFSHASFVEASLKGVLLNRANLSGANFHQARLATAQFRHANCAGVSFVGADMRFSECPDADFRGADLTDVDLTESVLVDILFDGQTKLQGTRLRGASMSDDFRAFAQQAGVTLSTQEEDDAIPFPAMHLAYVDGLITILQEKAFNLDGHLDVALPYVRAHRDKLAQDPTYDWSTLLVWQLSDELSEDIANEVLELYDEVISKFAYYV